MNWIQINENLLRRLRPEARYLVGVSGGRDSVFLLHWLVGLGYKKLVVCHLNHQLRGRSSDADVGFVRKLAASYDLDLEIRSRNVGAVAARKKLSVETAAREARYRFFAQVAKRRRCRTIFLAHHADDLVETFLMNLFRGAGVTGLSAMREIATRRVEDVDLTIARPLLGAWRGDIDAYVGEHQLKFREDASNKNLMPLRNRIRRRIIPYLEKTIGRNIRVNIWRAAMIAAEEEKWIESLVKHSDAQDIDLSVEKLRRVPTALQRRGIMKWLRARNVTDVGFEVIERVRSLLDRDARVAKINLPRDRHVRRRAGKLFIE
ncbi:MAG: tRNA lysidine(34) synthetase TilS [Verrucomicrobia bacterium]|nr:MAG: tRNA lysidine(34) synthetase TilS [Verrucomicrobiota bacterium]